MILLDKWVFILTSLSHSCENCLLTTRAYASIKKNIKL